MNKKIFLSLFLLASATLNIYSEARYAVVTVPVANLTLNPLTEVLSTQNPEQFSDSLPACYTGRPTHILREGQLLFNEFVEISEETEKEIKVKVLNSFYITPIDLTCRNEFWTLKTNLKILNEQDYQQMKFPTPILFTESYIPYKNTATLTWPIYETTTKKWYSAGTRFLIAPNSNATDKNLTASIYVPEKSLHEEILLPKDKCITSEQIKTTKEKVEAFVSLLRRWANIAQKQSIPFVWGGNSFIEICAKDNYQITNWEHSELINNRENSLEIYVRPDLTVLPYTGLDCSGLILRATQICGIPYFFKNSTTCGKYLRPMRESEQIEQGDIICFVRYNCVVSNLNENKFIGSRGYNSKIASVYEDKLENFFDGISTYEQLKEKHFSKEPVKIKTQDGRIVREKEIKILKLSSCWE